jgi:hypothetical protein
MSPSAAVARQQLQKDSTMVFCCFIAAISTQLAHPQLQAPPPHKRSHKTTAWKLF